MQPVDRSTIPLPAATAGRRRFTCAATSGCISTSVSAMILRRRHHDGTGGKTTVMKVEMMGQAGSRNA
jgi:hypothetical protein